MGYDRMYAHGGANGSIGLNAFANMAGFNRYIGKDEYANNADYDGVWGIWDHKFLPFYARECTKLNEPFLSSIFTVSSHDPFKLPVELSNRFANGPMTIYKSIRYADYSLRLFFMEAALQPWFRNTIFVITGDHTSGRFHDEYKTSLGAFGVPIIFYTPGEQLPARFDDRVAQQIDIMPTILNYLGYNKPYFAFGKDLLDDRADRIAVNYIGNTFQLIWDNWVIQHNAVTTVGLYDRSNDPLMKNNLVGKTDSVQYRMERKVKAVIQQYNNRMIDNRLVP
jgi:phosphoglycerol transferase MdoB-like AlkP superfamily enzyme